MEDHGEDAAGRGQTRDGMASLARQVASGDRATANHNSDEPNASAMTTRPRKTVSPGPATTDTVNVKLVDLIVDPENQIRARFDANTVERYASAMFEGVEFPPITIAVLHSTNLE